jgi:hypothetical protein
MRRRFWLETGLAALSGCLGLLTLVWRDWLEGVFGWDPDRHSGAVEWYIAATFLAAAVVLSLAARREVRVAASPKRARG